MVRNLCAGEGSTGHEVRRTFLPVPVGEGPEHDRTSAACGLPYRAPLERPVNTYKQNMAVSQAALIDWSMLSWRSNHHKAWKDAPVPCAELMLRTWHDISSSKKGLAL